MRKTKYREKIVGSIGTRTIKTEKKTENIHAIEVYDVNWTNYHKNFQLRAVAVFCVFASFQFIQNSSPVVSLARISQHEFQTRSK